MTPHLRTAHRSVQHQKRLPSFRPGRPGRQCRPSSLKGFNFRVVIDPGHATRMVATQQLDKAQHSTTLATWSLCSCKGVQAFSNKSYKLQLVPLIFSLPNQLPLRRYILSNKASISVRALAALLWQLWMPVGWPGRIQAVRPQLWPVVRKQGFGGSELCRSPCI